MNFYLCMNENMYVYIRMNLYFYMNVFMFYVHFFVWMCECMYICMNVLSM